MVSGSTATSRSHPASGTRTPGGDRSPGEFYQLDMEGPALPARTTFSPCWRMLPPIFARYGTYDIAQRHLPGIAYNDSMERFGSDMPGSAHRSGVQDITGLTRGLDFPPLPTAMRSRPWW